VIERKCRIRSLSIDIPKSSTGTETWLLEMFVTMYLDQDMRTPSLCRTS